MTVTYSENLSSLKDKVRLYLGDTDIENSKFTDEEINAVLGMYPSAIGTAIVLAQSLAAKYAGIASQSVGSVSISYGELSKNYRDLANELNKRASIEGGKMTAGGISISEKKTVEDNEDRVEPVFTRDKP